MLVGGTIGRQPHGLVASELLYGRDCCVSGAESEGTSQPSSPVTPRVSRLVASTRKREQELSSATVRRAAASIRCSQLSSTRSISLSPKASSRLSRRGRPGCSCTPKVPAITWGTSAPSDNGASSTSHTPSWYVPTSSLATSKASRILPQPPVPVRVKSPVIASIHFTSTISRSLPTKFVLGSGRLCLPAYDGSSLRGAVCWVGWNLPAAILSRRARVVAPGAVPSRPERVSLSRSYCVSASPRLPERAYRRIRPACASSLVGSSDKALCNISAACPYSPRSWYSRVSSTNSSKYSRRSCPRLCSAHSS